MSKKDFENFQDKPHICLCISLIITFLYFVQMCIIQNCHSLIIAYCLGLYIVLNVKLAFSEWS